MLKQYHVVLYEILKAGQDVLVAARIEGYGEGEKPRTLWSTMPSVDTQLDFIQGSVLEIVGAVDKNLDDILFELERDGWVLDTEDVTEQQPNPQTIYRTTHYVLRWRGGDA
jgi:hypothetical protein